MIDEPSVFMVTGIMASGKSTVSGALARRLPRAAHIRGDLYRRMIVAGQVEMSNPPSDEALAQLRLRQRMAARTADSYAQAGISAVVQDLYLGDDLGRMVAMIAHRPLYVVVLAPRAEVVEVRERARAKSGYGSDWSVADFDRHLRERHRESATGWIRRTSRWMRPWTASSGTCRWRGFADACKTPGGLHRSCCRIAGMIRTLWSYLAFRLVFTWTIVAAIALGVWISPLPLYARLGLLGVLLVAQWTIVDRVTGMRGDRGTPGDSEK